MLACVLFPALLALPAWQAPSEMVGPAPAPFPPTAGIHHITEFWGEQTLLDQTSPGMIRVNFGSSLFKLHMTAPNKIRWQTYDDIIFNNAGKILLVTVYPRHDALNSSSTPKIPETPSDLQAFFDFVAELSLRYSSEVDAWQLDNEVTVSGNWPVGKETEYALLLQVFADALHSISSNETVVISGFQGGSNTNIPLSAKNLLLAIQSTAPNAAHAFDLHHHRPWLQSGLLGDRLASYLSYIQGLSGLEHLRAFVTENSTWVGDPNPTSELPQDESQQAAYMAASLYSALGVGAEVCTLGVLRDRNQFKGQTNTKFTLNGLHFNPTTSPPGLPKESAYTSLLIQATLAGAPAGGVLSVPTGIPGLRRVEALAADFPHIVVWWEGSGSWTGSLSLPFAGSSALVVDLVPSFKGPWPPTDPLTGFSTWVFPSPGGVVQATLPQGRPFAILSW